MRHAPALALLVLFALPLTSCTTANPPEGRENADTVVPTESPVPATQAPDTPTGDSSLGYINEDSGTPVTRVPPAVWTETARADALAAADTALRLFARPSLDPATWWAALSPHLNQTARADYANVQPHTIPVTDVTGPGTITNDQSALVVTVTVPTNVGVYSLILNRADGEAPWLVSRFTPPAGVR